MVGAQYARDRRAMTARELIAEVLQGVAARATFPRTPEQEELATDFYNTSMDKAARLAKALQIALNTLEAIAEQNCPRCGKRLAAGGHHDEPGSATKSRMGLAAIEAECEPKPLHINSEPLREVPSEKCSGCHRYIGREVHADWCPKFRSGV